MAIDTHFSARLRRWLVVLCALAAVLGAAPSAGGAENGQVSISPTSTAAGTQRPFFTYQLERGGALTDSVTVTNTSDEALTLTLYATDAAVTTDGSFAPLNQDDPQAGLATWVELSETEVTLTPDERVAVEFTVTTPETVEPGDYAAAIVALQQGQGDVVEGEDVSLDVRSGVGARMYARVAGTLRPSIAVSSIELRPEQSLGSAFGLRGPATLEFSITNTGNTRFVPIVSAELVGLFGIGRHEMAERTLPDLLPGGSVSVTEAFESVRPAAQLKATVIVRSPDGQTTADASTRSAFVPWGLVAIVALIVLRFALPRVVRLVKQRNEA